MRFKVFLFLFGAVTVAAGNLETFKDEEEHQSIRNGVCNTSKKCYNLKGTCIPSLEICDGRIVNRGCGANCTCCVIGNGEKHKDTDWSSLIIPHHTTTRMNWAESWYRCQSLGATPFVPRTLRDFRVIKSVRLTVGEMWLPASDLAEEGVLRWWNGEDAPLSQALMWYNGQELMDNSDTYDCLLYGTPQDGVRMWDCSSKVYPMICVKNN